MNTIWTLFVGLIAIIAAMMALGMLTGCGGSTAKEEPAKDEQTTEAAAAEAAAEAALPVLLHRAGFTAGGGRGMMDQPMARGRRDYLSEPLSSKIAVLRKGGCVNVT